ncbi:Zinc finger protein MSN4 [Lentinula edodes]|uniref:Zinc finger protein MSN4 n=1 Tax=Lentinula edodes TaxID=5353 RepID=A0A1Q3EA72_LENED|nr:Zinc finger protein MSN4 [Lentinula edodes]
MYHGDPQRKVVDQDFNTRSKDNFSESANTMPPTETEESRVDRNNELTSNTSPRRTKKSVEKSAYSDEAGPASEKIAPISSGTRRPVTRSLSGRPIKRRIREDNALDLASYSGDDYSHPNEHPSATKKQKLAASSKRTTRKSAAVASKDPPSEKSSQAHELSTENPAHAPLVGLQDGENEGAAVPSTTTSSTAASTPQPMPLPSSSGSTSPLVATRIGTTRAMRATLPTPVPNLTKKSRGRRVPVRVVTTNGVEVIQDPPPVSSTSSTTTPGTGNGNTDSANPKGKRSYVCSVEGCGKCFHRGEHLKRHIRSIHTHDKPFKCTYPECDKNFNRHDNLLQHLKVHKQAQATAAMTASGGPVTLISNGKGKAKLKSKGSAEFASVGSKSRSKNSKGKKKKRRRSSSSSPDEEDEERKSETESAETVSSDDEDEVDEASAVSNLLSLRAHSGLKGASTLQVVAPLHHTLTSYTHTLTSLGSMSSTATLVGSVSGWGYPLSSSSSSYTTTNGNSITGSKPYFSPFHTSFLDATSNKSYSSMLPHNGLANAMPQFSLSKAYSSGATPYESSAAATASGTDADRIHDMHNGYHRHHNGLGHVQNMVSDVRSANGMNDSELLGKFQSNMATSSLRSTSTSSALRSTDGLEETNGSNGGNATVSSMGRSSPTTPLSRLGSEGHDDVDVTVRNLDPTLHALPTIPSVPANSVSKTSTTVISADAVHSSSNSRSTPANHSTTAPASPPDSKPIPDFQSNQSMSTGSVELNEPKMMLRPVESEKDWRM